MGLPGTFTGFEEVLFSDIPGWEGGQLRNTTRQHADSSGDLKGIACLAFSNGSNGTMRNRRTDIPWEDVIVEAWWDRDDAGVSSTQRLVSVATNAVEIQQDADGSITHRVNNAEVGTTGPSIWGAPHAAMLSSHVYFHASTGTMTTYKDGVEILATTGLNTEAGATAIDGTNLRQAGVGQLYVDDFGCRPRTVLVDGVTSADTATPTAITGTHTADVYAWENDSDDSAGGGGDPDLAPGEWRLYLKNCSIDPNGGAGWANNDAITVTGLTGTILVNAPAANYKSGMEPGSMFYFQRLFIIGMPPTATGTENTAGTLQGGAANRLDALDTNDSKGVRHTATGERVTLGATALSAARAAAISEVVALVVSVTALTDGGSPNAVKPRILDNGASPQNGNSKVVGATDTAGCHAFTLNGAGGQWATGSGVGGVDSAEQGYETA